MAREYEQKGFHFIFVYTREAHPGENYGPHRSIEQKLAHARVFQANGRIERPILVDDLKGTGHQLYGSLPNMTYIIGRSGRVLFRSDWTDPPTIEMFLKYLLDVRARRREGVPLAGFFTELVGYRDVDSDKFHQGLEVAGPQAVEDFARTLQRWSRQGSRPGRLGE